MKTVSSVTGITLAFALGSLVAGCRLPNTLGLDCDNSDQCIGAGQQFCDLEIGKCVSGNDPSAADTEDESNDEAEEDTGESETTESMKEDMMAPEDMGVQCGSAIGSCDKLDILLVIDNSGSITEDEFLKLIADTDFVEILLPAITEEPCDVRVGVTTTTEGPSFQPPECGDLGALNQAGALDDDCWGGGPPYFSTGDENTGLLCAIVPGSKYDTNERQMDAMINAISPPLTDPGGCNENFVREDAKLLLLLITDEDDDDDSDDPNEAPERTGSTGNPSEWLERIQEVKPLEDVGFLALMPIDEGACGEWLPLPGLSDGEIGTAEPAARISTFASLFVPNGVPDHVETIDLCQPVDDLTDEINNAREFLNAFCNG